MKLMLTVSKPTSDLWTNSINILVWLNQITMLKYVQRGDRGKILKFFQSSINFLKKKNVILLREITIKWNIKNIMNTGRCEFCFQSRVEDSL